jgi:hypothetical protein
LPKVKRISGPFSAIALATAVNTAKGAKRMT